MTRFDILSKSTDKTYYYKQLIKYNIFKEAYKRDSHANRLNSSTHDIMLIGIQTKYLASGTLEEYKITAREMELKKDPLIQFVGDVEEDKIRKTFYGGIYWE